MTQSFDGSFTAQAMLCDSAAAVDGKLYIQGGGWNAIAAATIPFAVPRIGIAMLLGVPYGETDSQHQLTVALEDEDGSALPLGKAAAEGAAPQIRLGFGVGRPPLLTPGDTQLLPFAMNIDGYVFSRAGGYAFVLTVDAEEVTRLLFRVHPRSK